MRVDCKKSLIHNESVLERDFEGTCKSFCLSFLQILCHPLGNFDSNGDGLELVCMKHDFFDITSNESKTEGICQRQCWSIAYLILAMPTPTSVLPTLHLLHLQTRFEYTV
jgi:hypothetical protein